ncbi:Os12g0227200 [Oryza sativa Japonica Group]|uniref:Os12g0227200 protein n=1 Tax=Oryza sativa subsp. japonica TaxID=39947 RepID=A0A0P0Y8A1_ORYSJ|nr:Os12g0227200 [Oryza sativa Japonica Group]
MGANTGSPPLAAGFHRNRTPAAVAMTLLGKSVLDPAPTTPCACAGGIVQAPELSVRTPVRRCRRFPGVHGARTRPLAAAPNPSGHRCPPQAARRCP